MLFTQIVNFKWISKPQGNFTSKRLLVSKMSMVLILLLGTLCTEMVHGQRYQFVLDTLKSSGKLILPDVGPSGARNLLIGDDVFFTDIDIPNIVGLYGVQDPQKSGFKLGLNGPTIYGFENQFFIDSRRLNLGGNSGASLLGSGGNLTIGNGRLTISDFGVAGSKNLVIGDDAFLTDLDRSNILGLYGNSDPTKGGLKLGSGGPDVWGVNGRLGVGTATPSEMLHVEGSIYGRDNIKTHAGQFQAAGTFTIRADNDNTGDDDIVFLGKDDEEKMKLKNGNLGIGTSDPTLRLHVKVTDPNGYVALFENNNVLLESPHVGNADGIAIKINKHGGFMGAENKFISFLRDNDSSVGEIRGYQYTEGKSLRILEDLLFTVGLDLQNHPDFRHLITLEGNIAKNVVSNLITVNYDAVRAPNFSPGSLPGLSGGFTPRLNPGSLPSIHWGSLGTSQELARDMTSSLMPYYSTLKELGLKLDKDLMRERLKGRPDAYQAFLGENPAATSFIGQSSPWDLAKAAFIVDLEAWAKDDGISYISKGADYAEWLPKANKEEEFLFGQIIGVKNGRISKSTLDADQIMVVSKNPIVLGNMIDQAQEGDYEKVGFMGQVPVQVLGTVSTGDYILASGMDNGFGVAISPDEIELSDFKKIVGRAWSDNEKPLGVVNVAIGLKTNEWVEILGRQEKRIDNLQSQLGEGVESRLQLVSSLEALTGRILDLENKSTTIESVKQK